MRMGVDLGGTKISAVVLDHNGQEVWKKRTPTPRGDYHQTIQLISNLVLEAKKVCGGPVSLGIGIPGSVRPNSGLVQNANSVWINDKPFLKDLKKATGQDLRMANDANCFALSEYHDGAAKGCASVFGVILGTGCGGGFVLNGAVNMGSMAIGGEWGHTPLPHPNDDETPPLTCWCGRKNCLELWISGPGMERDHHRTTGETLSAAEIEERARNANNSVCLATLARHVDRLARGLSVVVNILDPDIIVLGGGLSNMAHLYRDVPEKIAPLIFSKEPRMTIVPPKHGDDSGVRGAAYLWPSVSQRA